MSLNDVLREIGQVNDEIETLGIKLLGLKEQQRMYEDEDRRQAERDMARVERMARLHYVDEPPGREL